jgi:hypothetical protein
MEKRKKTLRYLLPKEGESLREAKPEGKEKATASSINERILHSMEAGALTLRAGGVRSAIISLGREER